MRGARQSFRLRGGATSCCAYGRRWGRITPPLVAAGIALNTLLAVFPALAVAVLIYGLFSSPAGVEADIKPFIGTPRWSIRPPWILPKGHLSPWGSAGRMSRILWAGSRRDLD
jgi:hypothetical protein